MLEQQRPRPLPAPRPGGGAPPMPSRPAPTVPDDLQISPRGDAQPQPAPNPTPKPALRPLPVPRAPNSTSPRTSPTPTLAPAPAPTPASTTTPAPDSALAHAPNPAPIAPPRRGRAVTVGASTAAHNVSSSSLSAMHPPVPNRPLPAVPARERSGSSESAPSMTGAHPRPPRPEREPSVSDGRSKLPGRGHHRERAKVPAFAPPAPPTVPTSSLSGRNYFLSHEEAAILIQQVYRGYIARKLYKKRLKDCRMRRKIVEEIVDTELVYLETLKALVEYFINPLQTASERILPDKSELRIIFPPTLEVIVNYNSIFCEDLQKRMSEWSSLQLIGDIFLKMTAFLKVYTDFVKAYDEAIKSAEKHMHNSHFAGFIQEAFERFSEASSRSGLIRDLPALLITPIQRIPRYTIFLNELVRYTWAEHPDYENLVQALEKMRAVAEYVNERAREAEAALKMTQIQQQLIKSEETIIDPQRRFIREGVLSQIKNTRDSLTPKKFYFFLFNDMLLCTKQKKSGKYEFIQKYPLNRAELLDQKPYDLDVDYMRYTFEMRVGTSTTIWLSTSTLENRNAWVRDVSNAINNLKSKTEFIDQQATKVAAQRAEKTKMLLEQQYAGLRSSDSLNAEQALAAATEEDLHALKLRVEQRYSTSIPAEDTPPSPTMTTESTRGRTGTLSKKEKKKKKASETGSIRKFFGLSFSKATATQWREDEDKSPRSSTVLSSDHSASGAGLRKHAVTQRTTMGKTAAAEASAAVNAAIEGGGSPEAGGTLRKHAAHRASTKVDPATPIACVSSQTTSPVSQATSTPVEPVLRKHAVLRRNTVATEPVKP